MDGEKKSFKPRAQEGIFLSWDSGIIQGAFVAVLDKSQTNGVIITRVSAPIPWPDTELETWKVIQNPMNEQERVWLSSSNRIKWTAPTESETATFEERTFPEQYEEHVDIMDAARRVEKGPEKDWRRFRHGVATSEMIDEEKLRIKRESYTYPDEDTPKVDEAPKDEVKCALDLRPFD